MGCIGDQVLCDYWTSAPIRRATHSEVVESRSREDNVRELIVVGGRACIALDAAFCRVLVRADAQALRSPDQQRIAGSC